MSILVRAIITGFGLKLGAEMARRLSQRLSPEEEDKKNDEKEEEEDVFPTDLSSKSSCT